VSIHFVRLLLIIVIKTKFFSFSFTFVAFSIELSKCKLNYLNKYYIINKFKFNETKKREEKSKNQASLWRERNEKVNIINYLIWNEQKSIKKLFDLNETEW